MLKIRMLRDRLIHNCVQCGNVVQYAIGKPTNCSFCRATQRINTLDRRASVMLDFVTAGTFNWRIWYHLNETNC